MIFKLLQELRPLASHNVLYNSHTHAWIVFSRLSLQTNDEAIMLAGLLHEVEEKLGEYKLRRCLEIIDAAHPRLFDETTQESQSLSERVAELLKRYKQPPEMSKEDWARHIIQEEGSLLERVLICDLTCEIDLTNSNTVRNNLKRILKSIEETQNA